MRKLTLLAATAVVFAAVVASGGRSQAAVPIGLGDAANGLVLVDEVTFAWQGHRYCWYSNGWRGPGWYRCGFSLRRGLGWGGPLGWHGWRRPGHGPVIRPPKPRPPGIHPPKPERPGIHPPKPGRPGGHRPRPTPR
jgi:hypothetical protein